MSGYSGSTGQVYARILESIEGRPITSRSRLGRVIHVDTFEYYTAAVTEKWRQAAGTIALSTANPKTGLRSMILTTGAAAGNLATARLRLGNFPTLTFGFEMDFMTFETITDVIVRVLLDVFDGTNRHRFGIQHDGADWQYFNAAGAWATFLTQNYYTTALQPVWHNLRFTVNMATQTYQTFLQNSTLVDLSALSYNYTGSGTAPNIICEVEAENITGTGARSFEVDNIILTDEEP